MLRLSAALLCLLAAGAALGQRAANVPAVQDPELARAMTTAVNALLQSVRGDPEFSERLRSYSMEDKLKLTLDAPEREKWAYWPTERSGLSFDLMHAKHRALTHELLWLLLSNRGYHKLLNIMQLENVLQPTSGTGFPRGMEEYSVTLFGEPSDTEPWAWRFEGHHVSLSITVVPGQGFTVTPTFFGADPADVTFGPLAGLRVLRVEEDLGLQLANSLTAAQLRTAVVPGTPDWNRTGGFTYPNDVPWDIVAATILRDRSDWNAWKTELTARRHRVQGFERRAASDAARHSRRALHDLSPRDRGHVSRLARSRRAALRVDRRPEERRAALLPHPNHATSCSSSTTCKATRTTSTKCGAAARATSARIYCGGIAPRRRTELYGGVTV